MKASYAAIVHVVALDNIHESTHEPEAQGLSRALSKQSTATAMYMVDYILPQVGKLSRILQTEHLDLSLISILVDSILQTHKNAISPAANWGLELLEDREKSEESNRDQHYLCRHHHLPKNAAKPFLSHLKNNISSHFASSSHVVSGLSIFDSRKVPGVDLPDLPQYGDKSIRTLLVNYGKEHPVETSFGETIVREATISSEWKVYGQLMTTNPEDNMKLQLKDLALNDMMKTMFSNFHTIASISLSIPVDTASVERSFSQIKLIKACLRSKLKNTRLSHLIWQ